MGWHGFASLPTPEIAEVLIWAANGHHLPAFVQVFKIIRFFKTDEPLHETCQDTLEKLYECFIDTSPYFRGIIAPEGMT